MKEETIPCIDALRWLTLRICINHDLAEVLLKEEEAKQATKSDPDVTTFEASQHKARAEYNTRMRMRFSLISLQWHAALLDNFKVGMLKEKFDSMFEERFADCKDLVKIQVLEFFKAYLNELFPHISTTVAGSHQVVLKIVATFFTAINMKNKNVYSREDIKKFGPMAFCLILLETANRIKSVLRMVFMENKRDMGEASDKDHGAKVRDKDKEVVNRSANTVTEKAKAHIMSEGLTSSSNFLGRLYQIFLKDPCGKKRALKRQKEAAEMGSSRPHTKRDSQISKQVSERPDKITVTSVPNVDTPTNISRML